MDDSNSEELYSSGDNLGDQHLNKRNSPVSDSSEEIRRAAEESLLSSSSTLDVSRKNIKHLTEETYRLPNIKYLHLEGNVISTLPEDLFQKLPHLVWLDLRYNKIKALPPGIGFHRQLKTLLLERNPIKELPAELGHLTSLTALNLRHCPLEFPPKEVIQKGLKSILSFLRNSGNGNLPCMEPATSETPLVAELNLSELLQRSLDLSQERPSEEEKRRFQRLWSGITGKEKEELLAEGHDGAAQGRSMARSRLWQKTQLCPHSVGPGRTLQVKRAEKCKSAGEKELRKERALFEQRKNSKEVLWEWCSQAKLRKERREAFRFLPTKADAIPKNAPYATGNISHHTMNKRAEKQDPTPQIVEEWMLGVKAEATRSCREKRLEQHIKQHTPVVKARGAGVKRIFSSGNEESKTRR